MKRKFNLKNPLASISGIYMISFENTKNVYIGETKNLSNRISKHFALLRKNKHHNKWFQSIFNKHGEENAIIEVLEYCKSASKEELREKEVFYQKQAGDNCLNFDKNKYSWNRNVTELQKKENAEQLNSIRQKAMEACSVEILVYNIKTKEKIFCKTLKEACSYVEEKHLYNNVKHKKFTPYKGFVCFLPEEFDESKICYNCKSNVNKVTVFTKECILYDLLNNVEIKFPNENQFSLYFSNSENWKLFKEYSKSIDPLFRTAMNLSNVDEFLNSDYKLRFNSHKKVKVKDYIDAIFNYRTNIELSKKLNTNRHTIKFFLKDKSIDDRIKEINKVMARLKSI